MIIDKALFRNGTDEEIVTLESNTHHENYLTVKVNLYSITPNCGCKLMCIPKGLKISYLKNGKDIILLKNVLFIKKQLKALIIRIAGKTVSRLRDEHVRNVLKETFDKFNETDKERKGLYIYASNEALRNKLFEYQSQRGN